jgi:hypothetical protein
VKGDGAKKGDGVSIEDDLGSNIEGKLFCDFCVFA